MKKKPKMYADTKLSYRMHDQMSLDKSSQFDELNTILLPLKTFFQAG